MPIKPSQIVALLHAKQADFKTFDQVSVHALQKYRTALAEAAQQSNAEIREALASDHPGALPLEPLGTAENWVIPSKLVWQSREQSLAWVRDRLMGIATFAVDGSQIFPSKDLSIPVALVQVGWFENLHLPTGDYEKDIEVDVMTPADLQVSNSSEPVDRRVNMRRFEMETQRLIRYMQDHANSEGCLVFFDGSLIATFAEAFDPESRAFYVNCLLELLHTSETCRVPLVAYIDTSYARDLTVMLQHLCDLPETTSIHDAQLLNKFMEWGDRTPLFLCQRSGIQSSYQDHTDKIAFTYLKTTNEGYPARLEIPLWVYEAGWLERVMDWVRGEVIIGSGYPYVIETADQTAVLQTADRQAFQRIFQDWAESEDLNLRFSRKMVSKVRRR
ncbi:MAG: DNA double-strand break repair nuclease NurA [Leptolyngbyaceae bacterium]|nr:DNA double-strand break repair nuclease NurA [Leptolyngbyaceae bacterium]